MDDNVRAVLVKKRGESGAFRVTGGGDNQLQNVVTGPKEVGVVIVEIKPGQTGMCFGRPSLRRFYTRPE
jgi:hypothetical protein